VSVHSLRSAIQFLTVVPIGRHDAPPANRLGRAYFPLVGALIGLPAGVIYVLAAPHLGRLFAAAAAVATVAVLTGGLHLDGLADAADGLLGGGTAERRLEIMRDPRVGSFGVIALVLVLVSDVSLLSTMSPARAMAGLLVAGAISRLAVLAVILSIPHARSDGLGVAVAGGHRARDLAVGALLTVIVCLIDPRRSAVAVALAMIATLLVVRFAQRRIGGATGDVYGACSELCQLAVLAAFAAT
jgi:adenosylcobinamide-GDP ribazoletransferase